MKMSITSWGGVGGRTEDTAILNEMKRWGRIRNADFECLRAGWHVLVRGAVGSSEYSSMEGASWVHV